jgi:hypothetical protein
MSPCTQPAKRKRVKGVLAVRSGQAIKTARSSTPTPAPQFARISPSRFDNCQSCSASMLMPLNHSRDIMSRFTASIAVFGLLAGGTARAAQDYPTWAESVRQKLCDALPEGERCEPAKPVFRPPPAGSANAIHVIDICRDGVCSPSKLTFPPRREEVPAGSSLRERFSITVTLKDGTRKFWSADNLYEWQNNDWQGDEHSHESWDLLGFDQVHRCFWIEESGYESSNTQLVYFDTGQTRSFSDAQLFLSPDGARLLTFEGEGYENTLALYAFSAGALQHIGDFDISHIWEGRSVGCCNAEFLWVTREEVAILDSDTPHRAVVLARIKLKGGKWILSTPATKDAPA